jgi:hypothetical protein
MTVPHGIITAVIFPEQPFGYPNPAKLFGKIVKLAFEMPETHISIQFNANEFFFILGKYYRGGEYDYLLNKQMDTDEFYRCPFIVFELDNIRNMR